MDCLLSISEAKCICIKDYLASIGIHPEKNGFYFMPFYKEKTASFRIYIKNGKERWKHFGTDEDGDIIDLVKRLHNVKTNDALRILSKDRREMMFFSFKGDGFNIQPSNNKLEVRDIKPISHPSLIRYLQQRGISVALARSFCKEVWYSNNGLQFFSLGFPNDSNGWELRSAIFKGCISPKSISTIPGDKKSLNIFEGFFDFLSCLTFYQVQKLKYQTIVLNTISNFKYIKDSINLYPRINMFLDNDRAGENIALTLQNTHTNAHNISKDLYPECNDFNDFITRG